VACSLNEECRRRPVVSTSRSETEAPQTQRFVDPIVHVYPTLPFPDERHFDDLASIVSVEPVKEQDKVMT
jgi:hypothetical protein